MSARGLFIVFEGVDRTGKTTQAKRVIRALNAQGVSACDKHFPAYELSSGVFLRNYLLSYSDPANSSPPLAIHLMFAANRAECLPVIEALLAQGTHVICDRYVYSGIAYSVAKGLSMKRCQAIEADLPMPDAVFYFHAPVNVVAARKDFGPERHDDTTFLAKVQAAYADPTLRSPCQRWIEIDASREPTAVERQVDEHMEFMLAMPNRPPLVPLFEGALFAN